MSEIAFIREVPDVPVSFVTIPQRTIGTIDNGIIKFHINDKYYETPINNLIKDQDYVLKEYGAFEGGKRKKSKRKTMKKRKSRKHKK